MGEVKRLVHGGGWMFAALFAGISCAPLLFLLSGAGMNGVELKDCLGAMMGGDAGYVSWRLVPRYPTMRNFVELLMDSPGYFVMFWNSLRLTAGILAGQLIVGVPAAWGLARFDFPCRRLIYQLYVALMMLPFQVWMLSEYLVLDRLRLLNTHAGIILPAVFSTFPVFLMYRFFAVLPEAVIESARLDGAGNFRIFWYIGLPLGSGGIVSAMVLGFLEYWNMIEQPMTFLKDKSLWPMSLFLPEIGLEQAGLAMAAALLMALPSLLVLCALRRTFPTGASPESAR